MRTNRGTVVVGVAVVVGLVATWGVGTRAKEEPKHSRGCNVATIKGTYGIQISGTRPSGPGGPIESVIGLVIRHYDGRGQFDQVDNVKGSITGMVPNRQGFGTYQVNEDCSGTMQFQPGPGVLLEGQLVIVDDGNEIRGIISQPPPVMVSDVQKRINTR